MSTMVRRKRGPVAHKGRVRVTLYLDEAAAEWGKRQDGGLSELVRQLLAGAQARSAEGDPYPPELRAAYRRLIDTKYRNGLTPEQTEELADVRAEMNRIDRTTEAWRQQQRATAIIERKLAELRRDIEAELERSE